MFEIFLWFPLKFFNYRNILWILNFLLIFIKMKAFIIAKLWLIQIYTAFYILIFNIRLFIFLCWIAIIINNALLNWRRILINKIINSLKNSIIKFCTCFYNLDIIHFLESLNFWIRYYYFFNVLNLLFIFNIFIFILNIA